MTQTCAVCDGDRFEDCVVAYDRVEPRTADYLYRRCQGCSLLALWPMPSADEVADFYTDDYLPHRAVCCGTPSHGALSDCALSDCAPPQRVGSATADDRRARRLRNRLAVRHLYATDRARSSRALRGLLAPFASSLMRELLVPRGRNRLLDVGCGAGELMRRHRALGWQVRGVEPSERGAAACRAAGLRVEQSPLVEADLPEASFDVIVLNHVIEHVLDPLQTMVRARALLAPNGLLLVVTPNVAGIGFRLYGSCWYALDAPRHLNLFSASTLARLARRTQLVVERISTEASTRVLRNSQRYARTQGRLLPGDLRARTELLTRSREAPGPSAGLWRLCRPPASALALAGLGETLRGRFLRGGA
jgi:2-polyprenyl-3-methyl-5-hydroxy-6-metoxy-1,4-benzoquinol methylase